MIMLPSTIIRGSIGRAAELCSTLHRYSEILFSNCELWMSVGELLFIRAQNLTIALATWVVIYKGFGNRTGSVKDGRGRKDHRATRPKSKTKN
jgi:hypothetical protein